jgi:hypothetical protein
MRIVSISALLALVSIVGLGCQSSTAPAAPVIAAPQRAVIISGANSGGTTVFLPSDDLQNPTMLCSGTAACLECKAAAIEYFTTGVLDPKCSRTGATRTAVTINVPINGGHN